MTKTLEKTLDNIIGLGLLAIPTLLFAAPSIYVGFCESKGIFVQDPKGILYAVPTAFGLLGGASFSLMFSDVGERLYLGFQEYTKFEKIRDRAKGGAIGGTAGFGLGGLISCGGYHLGKGIGHLFS